MEMLFCWSRLACRRLPGRLVCGLVLAAGIVTAPDASGELPEVDPLARLKRLSFEELLNVDVTTVSKREQKASEAPAAVYVITAEEIRRSGATSIPQALRLAPNLQVAQIDSRRWAISSRGFNGEVANKLLVMIDGRSVYTPLFSGVFWDVQDYLLEDIDRIEVISGPGGTLWGANAVNGVINVITRKAADTQGLLFSGGGGNIERGFGSLRYGGKLSDAVHYRVYGKYFNRDSTRLPSGRDAKDDWQMGQGGFRLDWDAAGQNLLTFQGDVYGGRINQAQGSDIGVSGHNLLARWTHVLSFDSDLQLQLYYDRTWRRIPQTFAETLDTYDLDFQHRFMMGNRHRIIWGAGYRLMDDRVENSPALAFLPPNVTRQLFSGFLQDEIELLDDRVYLTLGSKLEHNDYTGFEVQPSARLAWQVTPQQTLWGAVSRAVRTPSRIDREFFVPGTPPFTIAGGPGFRSAKLMAYELGHRAQIHERVIVSLTGFYHDYDDVRSVEPGPPLMIDNGLEGEAYGLELAATLSAADWWQWHIGYTRLEKRIRLKSWSRDVNQGRAEGSDPENQLFLRSRMNLPGRVEFDTAFRFIDRLENFSGGNRGTVPSYAELDARLAWEARPGLELSVVGHNLLHSRHPEFGFPSAGRSEIPRSVFGKITWHF